MCLSPALTISVKKWRCCLPAAEPTWLKGIRVQGSRGHLRAAVKERVRLWGLFLSSNPHCSPPRGLLQVPGYKSCWRQDRSPAFLCFPQEEKKFKIRGARRGSKKMCVCASVCLYTYMHIQISIHIQTHMYTHRHTHTHTKWLQCLVVGTTLGRGRPVPCFMDHYRGFIGVLFFSFDETDNCGKTKQNNICKHLRLLETLAG